MLKTTYQIFDSSAGKTIVFRNLYFIDGKFIFNGTASGSEIATYPNVHYRHTKRETWAPAIMELPDQNDVPVVTTPHFYLKESVNNYITHALADDVFSVFYSLYRCRINYNPCVCIVETSGGETFHDCKGIFRCLFGQEAIGLNCLKETYSQVCFETFVVGNGDSGSISFDSNYASPFQDNIWRQFRDAYYKESEIDLEVGKKILYGDAGKFPIQSDLKDILLTNNVEIIRWDYVGDIKEQLRILKGVKIYITTDGAPAINTIFLPDNAIVINLGRVYANGNYRVLGYCSCPLFPALSHIDVFYFEDYYLNYHKAQDPYPNPGDLMDMIESLNDKQKKTHLLQRRAEIYDNFALKVMNKIDCALKLNNFSPNARLLLENYSNLEERDKVIEELKRGNTTFECNEKVRPFRVP